MINHVNENIAKNKTFKNDNLYEFIQQCNFLIIYII